MPFLPSRSNERLIGIDCERAKLNNHGASWSESRTGFLHGTLPLFSTVIHLLTLAAFNLHALVGCCGHHVHEHGTCVHTEVCDSSTSHEDPHTHAVADEDADRLTDDLVAAWLGCDHPTQAPTDHSHSCDEGSCVFLMSRLAPLADLTTVLTVLPIDVWQIRSDSTMLDVLRTGSETRCAFTLVGHRCALQQSWQI